MSKALTFLFLVVALIVPVMSATLRVRAGRAQRRGDEDGAARLAKLASELRVAWLVLLVLGLLVLVALVVSTL